MPSGIHHVTSIASSPRRNLDFYAGALGLRLVKKTVNFDDPCLLSPLLRRCGWPSRHDSHLFPLGGAAPGRLGVGETQETVFSVPEGSIGYWTQRLVEKGAPTIRPPSASAQRRSRSRIKTGRGSR